MPGPLPSAETLRDQILAHTKVDVNPKSPRPGERMTVETIPGILPFNPVDLAGNLPLPTGPLDVTINSLTKIVEFSVQNQGWRNGLESAADVRTAHGRESS